MPKFFNKSYPTLILLLLAIFTYWQASFLFWTFKWDMLDVVFPWRYHVGECLQNGIFPFWNPYQQTGYPIHADLQCPVWYPETWIIGSITGYNIFILHLLFVLTIFSAGFGMYKLAFYFNKRRVESLAIGATYMLSGFFVAHGQHLFALIGAAYIPFVIYFFLKLLESPTAFNLCKLALFTYLLISGGYQMLTIITGYLLLTILIFYLIKNVKNRIKLASIIKYQIIFGIVILLMCLPIIISVTQISDYTSRFKEGIVLNQILQCPFSPQSFISVLFPYATTMDGNFFATDISMRNMYIGIIVFVFLIVALFRNKKSIEWLFLGFGFVCLLASLGNYLPVRKLLADFFPMMGQFRSPSYFSVFFIIAMLISLSIHLPEIIDSIKHYRKKTGFIVSLLLVLILIINLYSYFKTGSGLKHLLSGKDLYKLATGMTMFDRIFIQSIVHVTLLLLLVLIIFKISNQKLFKVLLMLLIFMDLFVSTNLNSYYTTFFNYSPFSLQADISKYPKGFPIPYHEKIGETTDNSMTEFPLWRNMGNFQKRITFNGFTSLQFNDYAFLSEKEPVLKDSILSNYLIYFSDKILPFDSLSKKHLFSSKDIFVKPAVYDKLKSIPFKLSNEDTIVINKFSPNSIKFTAKTDNYLILTLLQEHYKGWEIYIDGIQGEIFNSNSLYMSAVLKPGRHLIEFKYTNNLILLSSIITAMILLLILLYLIHCYYKARSINILIPSAGFLLLIIALLLFIYHAGRTSKYDKLYDDFKLKLIEIAASYPKDSVKIALNTDLITDHIVQKYAAHYFRFKTEPDFNDFREYIATSSQPYFIYGYCNAFNPPDVKYYIQDTYPCIVKEFQINGYDITVYSKNKKYLPEKHLLEIRNGFENKRDILNSPDNRDSTNAYKGRYSFRLDSLVAFSPTYEYEIKDLVGLAGKHHDHFTIDISAYIYMTEGAKPFIVFEKKSFLKYNIWKPYDLRKHNNKNNQWIFVRTTIEIPKGYSKKDKIKLCFWNNSKSGFFIDNLEIKID